MSLLHIANYFECDRVSAVSAAAMPLGTVVQVSDNGSGERWLAPLATTPVAGKYAIVTKESVDPNAVSDSTVPNSLAGSRIPTIASGDAVLELRRGAKVEYSNDLLDDSLVAANGGTAPVVGDKLAVKGGKWAAAGAAGIVSGSAGIGEVFRVFGTNVVIELI